MYKVIVEKECECFVKSDFKNNQVFESQVSAQMKAMQMVTKMNKTFCNKHSFIITEDGDNLIISMGSGCCGKGCCV